MKHVFRTMVSAMILAAVSVIPAMAGEMPAPYRELVKSVQDEFAGGCPRYQAWYSGNCEANENLWNRCLRAMNILKIVIRTLYLIDVPDNTYTLEYFCSFLILYICIESFCDGWI
ncbi:MAG: hypothetical protein V8R61_10170 [Enterocloster sp.]